MTREQLRKLPATGGVLKDPLVAELMQTYSRVFVRTLVRRVLDRFRGQLLADEQVDAPSSQQVAREVVECAREVTQCELVPAINATGIVLHTGLGRAVLAPAARRALAAVARGYAYVEVDRASGQRGVREHASAALLQELTGASAATVVNNNAAACLLMLAGLCAGREVIVARGQLVEIGGSFRIPEVMAQSGAKMVEVGATNRVHLADYERAIGPNTAAILRVHTSNFKVVGFHDAVEAEPLADLAKRAGVLLFEDLGSGNLIDLTAFGLGYEPSVAAVLAQGVDVVCCSGDKLLGGPQAGLLLGRGDLIAKLRAHPLFRALRPCKLTLAALEATLQLFRLANPQEAVPALAMLTASAASLRIRAKAIAARLPAVLAVEVVESEAQAGSGALPAESVPSAALVIRHPSWRANRLARALRLGSPAVFARIADDAVVCDLRAVVPDQDEALATAFAGLVDQSGSRD